MVKPMPNTMAAISNPQYKLNFFFIGFFVLMVIINFVLMGIINNVYCWHFYRLI